MKILIIEAYTDGNIGSAALVENSIALLKQNFPGAQMRILAQFPEHIARFCGYPSQPELITMPFKQARSKQLVWFIQTAVWMLVNAGALYLRRKKIPVPFTFYTFNPQRRQALESFLWDDMIVSVGAERINDNFYKAMFFSLYMLWCARLCGKFLVLFPATIGPFHYAVTKFVSRRILNRCHVIYLRDERSYRTVRRLKITRPQVLATCDVAVLQQALAPAQLAQRCVELALPVPQPLAQPLPAPGLHHAGAGPNTSAQAAARPWVGFSVLRWSYANARGVSRYTDYKLAVARAADYLIEQAGVDVFLLATNVPVHGCREDDVATIGEIGSMIKNKDRVYAVTSLLTPAEIKSLISHMELCVMTRMHASIFSTGSCTPTVTINYQFKLKEYMKLLGLGRYTIDIDEVFTESLIALVGRGWQDRHRIRRQLVEKMAFWQNDLKTKMSLLPAFYNAEGDSA
jgi:polysaccharide pyruvyl transferase WcaK-like protein